LAEQARRTPRVGRRAAPRRGLTDREPEPDLSTARVLVQLVPMSGNRQSQLGIRADTMASFFGLRPGDTRRVRLQQVQSGRPPEPLEPPRPLVFPAGSNQNSRIEVGGLRHVRVTEANRPIVVFEQVAEDRFRYL